MTLKEISEKTGFSITTISRVMNRTGYVNEETYRKVMQAAEEGGYFQKKKEKFWLMELSIQTVLFLEFR